jgi:SNF2-related domain
MVCACMRAVMPDADMVFTTYDCLRLHGKHFKRLHWHRCVLDECQEIKVATTNIAQWVLLQVNKSYCLLTSVYLTLQCIACMVCELFVCLCTAGSSVNSSILTLHSAVPLQSACWLTLLILLTTQNTEPYRLCHSLKATHRWMVSGTPLSSSINDLHGELNFLRVWPFALQNDGFWWVTHAS